MSKKIIFLLLILVFVVVGVIFYFSNVQEKMIIPVAEKKQTPTSAAKKLKEYKDSSGFKFNYPEDLRLNANDVSTSNSLYADITLKTTDRKGQIAVKVADTTKTFFDESLKDKNTIETSLGDIAAYQYQEKNMLITTAYDQGVGFTITVDLAQEKNYWFGVNKQIINSFEFVQPEQSTTSSNNSASEEEIIFEGEETIE